MSERTPMETLREIETALELVTDSLGAEIEDRYADTKDHPAMAMRYRRDLEDLEVGRRALAMLRELREGAVEGFVTGDTGNCRFDDGSTCITSALPSRPALLLTTKPRGEG